MRRSSLALVALVTVTVVGIAGSSARWMAARPAESPDLARSLDDPTIVAIFDAANTADIETGALASKRGHAPEVREFGAMLARDHAQVRQLGRDLAGKLGVTPTPPKDDASARAHAAAMTHLRTLEGAEFDHAFLRHEVTFHKAVIDAVQTTLLPAIKNGEVKALVVKVAPAFQAHMLAAQQLDETLTKAKK
jgi:putative membrane protein